MVMDSFILSFRLQKKEFGRYFFLVVKHTKGSTFSGEHKTPRQIYVITNRKQKKKNILAGLSGVINNDFSNSQHD